MKHLFTLLTLAITFTACKAQQEIKSAAIGNQIEQSLTDDVSKEVDIDYLLHLPGEYDTEEKWPLLIFLHGAGERGEDLNLLKKWGPTRMVAQGEDLPYILVSPQCPEQDYWNSYRQQTNLIALLDKIIEDYKVDEDRIYLTGLSMGGFGTWELAATLNDRIAGAVPICGGGNWAKAWALSGVPIWAFHGAEDNVVPVTLTEDMVNHIDAIGGNVKMTIYPGVGHDSWIKAYADEEMWEWLFNQKLSDR